MSDAHQCCLDTNPDITGIGVRLALYIQIMLGWFFSWLWPNTFAKNARAAYMTAIALLIAAFIQLQTQTLSLLDGIVVSLITTMMITFSISSSPTRNNTNKVAAEAASTASVDPNASLSRFLTQFVFIGFWAAWCIHLWQDPLRFGFRDLPDCDINNNVTIVVFGREIHATDGQMRAAALALVSIGTVIAVGSLFISLETLLTPCIRGMRSFGSHIVNRGVVNGDMEPQEDSILKLIRRSLQFLSFGTLVYLIATTELTIKQNDTRKTSKEWSYGQTIALILLLQQVMDIASTYLEIKEERKEEEMENNRNMPMAPYLGSNVSAQGSTLAKSVQPTTDATPGTGIGVPGAANGA